MLVSMSTINDCPSLTVVTENFALDVTGVLDPHVEV